MHFLDKAKIYIKAGNGGNGSISFRREKYIEFGGPNGGNGGDGGNVYIVCDPSLNTLIDFRYTQHFKAQKGEHGKGNNRFGKKGEDLIIKVPVGTIVWNADQTAKITTIDKKNNKFLIAKAGCGGRGNNSFKSATNQAPKIAEEGTEGEEIWVWLELQLIADVGLIGMPNAGKSTFLSIVSNAKPKIANYPFSTLIPKLGVVNHKGESFVMADIPGLIKGASDGKGLGLRFLSHLSKCSVLIHMIDANNKDYYKTLNDVNNELIKYKNNIITKKQIIVLNKVDTIEKGELNIRLERLKNDININEKNNEINIMISSDTDVFLVSCVSKLNIDKVLSTLLQYIKKDETENTKKDWSPV